ncbi:UDP-2,3-diacylglucosamine diphosphatase [Geobacter sp. SVR]|uniref:UDP-2,3-diacylglucosamine diphosphatase n=1 Tax=Geobacter sp. SVR TaxID=2495594 RepID=UPI00143EFDF5|nr:UDP-2,3-diacylglucosamine diphosphatase [Geobacter sp. SVR]BCS55272.1 UDP-2,3-diacylglucosamine hydrolase [Geobacter sp. SVR]GCF86071.1 UDP-2,3-diacylglucosamine hydrolase [Geobacter sp. SVR]
MRTIFLADAHLTEPTEPNYRLLLRFLHELEGTTETLFIMGDLFDFWLGFPSHPFRQHDPLLDALMALKRSGCRLIYFEGNHDFHLGPLFRESLAAEIHTGPIVRTVQGRRLYLCHGDQINRADRGYRLLRLVLHNALVAWGVNHFPPSLALQIKERLQRTSKAGYHQKSARWDYRDIICDFARSLREQGCDGLVTGHFHLAFHEELASPRFTILSLGDWMERFTYGEIENGELLLKSYSQAP